MLVSARLAVLFLFGLLASGQAPPNADWQKATDLPALDVSGLSKEQKQVLLTILREEGCTCQCRMKIAECRVKDPPCGDSRTLAAMAVEALKAGKTPDQVRAALRNSELARARQARMLGDPVLIPIDGAPSLGPSNARVTIVEFSDFQCPYCKIAAQKIREVVKAYPGDVRLVFKQFPIDTHPQAELAAEASLAAASQGKFWQLHDRMFASPNMLDRGTFNRWGLEIGLDLARFNDDIDARRFRAVVAKDYRDGASAGVQGTPTFFLNGRHWRGDSDLESLRPVIDNEIQKQIAAAK